MRFLWFLKEGCSAVLIVCFVEDLCRWIVDSVLPAGVVCWGYFDCLVFDIAEYFSIAAAHLRFASQK